MLELTAPGGRLHESRAAILARHRAQPLPQARPARRGACTPSSASIPRRCRDFDDQQFALDLLEQKHVLVAPGVSFNVPYRNHFRITNLPDAATLREVFARAEDLLGEYAAGRAAQPRGQRRRS